MLKKVDVAILIITLGAVLWAAGLIAWNYWRGEESARLMGCRQNLVRLAEAAARGGAPGPTARPGQGSRRKRGSARAVPA